MRGTTRAKYTGRDLNRWVTLLLPQVSLQRTERGVLVPGSGPQEFRRVRVKAMHIGKTGMEGMDEKMQADTRQCTWIIVWRSGLTSKAQVEDEDGVAWNIRGIREVPRRAFWMLDCTARPEQS